MPPKKQTEDVAYAVKTLCELLIHSNVDKVNYKALSGHLGVTEPKRVTPKINSLIKPHGFVLKTGKVCRLEADGDGDGDGDRAYDGDGDGEDEDEDDNHHAAEPAQVSDHKESGLSKTKTKAKIKPAESKQVEPQLAEPQKTSRTRKRLARSVKTMEAASAEGPLKKQKLEQVPAEEGQAEM